MQTYYIMIAERENTLTVRLSRDEQHMVKALAAADGISVSDVVRMLVRRAHRERFGEAKTKPKK